MALLIALVGCDMVGPGGGNDAGSETAGNAGEAAATRAAASGDTRPAADAGLTSSRSLAGLSGGGEKDPAAIPVSSGASLDSRVLLGRWADDEACKTHVTLRPDGTFLSYTGGEGSWTLEGDRLELTGAEGTFALRVQSIEGDIMTVINADGSIGRSRRC